MLGYLQNLWRELDTTALLYQGIRVAAVFLCLTVHETCHGLAALALGDPTAKERHRISLNPLRHIDWFGLALMFTAGFGWAKPVPVDPRYFRNPKWGMAVTALAGPLSNFVLAFLAVFAEMGLILWLPESQLETSKLLAFLVIASRLSIGLGLFNLLPFPPLDGSKVAAALLPDRVYIQWMRYERFGMLILLAATLLGWNFGFIDGAARWIANTFFQASYAIWAVFMPK